MDPAEFRRLLGSFATGVTVVTTLDREGEPAGMTASAISAVSLEPPLLLVCVSLAAELHPVLSVASEFAVNVLARDQEHLSRRFALEGIDRFAGVALTRSLEGLPLLDGVVAHILCRRHEVTLAGDHSVFLGRVVGGETFDRQPLLHFRGRYY